MPNQIRINKTKDLERALNALKEKKYPLMSDTEVIRYLISRDYSDTFIIDKHKDRAGEPIEDVLKRMHTHALKAGKAFLKKKGLKLDNVSDDDLYRLIKYA